MEETLDKILQHQKLTYELLAVLFGDGPIRDEFDIWNGYHKEESA